MTITKARILAPLAFSLAIPALSVTMGGCKKDEPPPPLPSASPQAAAPPPPTAPIELVPEIPRTTNGTFRAVINQCAERK